MCKVSTLQCYKSIFKHPNVLCFTVSWLFILTIKEYTSELCHLTTGSHLFLSKPSSALNRMRKLALLDGLLGQRCKLLQHGCFFSFRFSFLIELRLLEKERHFQGAIWSKSQWFGLNVLLLTPRDVTVELCANRLSVGDIFMVHNAHDCERKKKRACSGCPALRLWQGKFSFFRLPFALWDIDPVPQCWSPHTVTQMYTSSIFPGEK